MSSLLGLARAVCVWTVLCFPFGQVALAEERGSSLLTARLRVPDLGETGAGLVVQAGGQCVIVTAAHVVSGAPKIIAEAAGEVAQEARLLAEDGKGDVAVLSVKSDMASCPPLPSLSQINEALSKREGAILVSIDGGEVVRVPVRITIRSDQHVALTSLAPSLEITQGMSGAPVVVDNVPIAVLTHIDERAAGQPGIAFRIDEASKSLGAYLPLVRVTVLNEGLPRGQQIETALKTADPLAIAELVTRGARGPDFVAAMRRPDGTEFVVTRFFEAMAAEPKRTEALRLILDAGLGPETILPARYPRRAPDSPTYRTALLWQAIDVGAAKAALLILERGSSPHAYRDPTGTSRDPVMLYPFEQVVDRIQTKSDRDAILAAMIKGGLVVPPSPRRFHHDPAGKFCLYPDRATCSANDRGRWTFTWPEFRDAEASKLLSSQSKRLGVDLSDDQRACRRSATYSVKPPQDWVEALAQMPTEFEPTERARQLNPNLSRIEMEGFIGVFDGAAWFVARRLQPWLNGGDDFFLIIASKDLREFRFIQREANCEEAGVCFAAVGATMRDRDGRKILRQNVYDYVAGQSCRTMGYRSETLATHP